MWSGRACVLHLRDHLLAAAGIARDGIDGDRVVGRAGCRPATSGRMSADRAGRIAAGIGDEARRRDLLGLAARPSRRSRRPSPGWTRCAVDVSMMRVELLAFEHARPLRAPPRRAGTGSRCRPRSASRRAGRVLRRSASGIERSSRSSRPAKPRADLQAGGAVFAVDEDLRFHVVQFRFETMVCGRRIRSARRSMSPVVALRRSASRPRYTCATVAPAMAVMSAWS